MKAPRLLNPDSVMDFQALPLLNLLSPLRRHLLINQAELKALSKGDWLFRQGDVDNRLYYLLDGELELSPETGQREILETGTKLPLCPLQPRPASARALAPTTVLNCERRWFDALLLPSLLRPLIDKDYRPASDECDWLQRLMASAIFQRLPAANLQQLFSRCEALAFTAGQTVLSQGGHGTDFYLIQSGYCEASCIDEQSRSGEMLARLGPGDWFGEVGLLAGVPNSMTVTMQTEGAMLRLHGQDFDELVRLPLLEVVAAQAANQHLQNGARWLDVREAAEVKADPHPGALHLPFSELIHSTQTLDRSNHYIVLCDSGARSVVAAFLLATQGYTSSCLRGGLATARGFDCGADDSESVTANNRSDPLLQALRNELTGLLRQVDHAMRLKRDAESARREAERAAVEQMNAERERLNNQSHQVREMFAQTQKLQKRLVEERQRLFAGVRQREQAMDQRVSDFDARIEQRVAEERERIAAQYQAREAEIEHLQNEKQAAQARWQDVTSATIDKQRARAALEAEFDQFNRHLQAGEAHHRQAQAEAAHEIISKLGNELAAGDEELSEYEDNKQKLSRQREQLQSEACALSSKVQAALIDKQATLAVRKALEDEARRLQESEVNTDQRNHTDAALREASARFDNAELAHEQALIEQKNNAAALAQTEQAASELFEDMSAEIEGWLQDQARQPRSRKQEALIRRYEETMQRMQAEAADAEERERTRDDLLLSEINAELETIAERRARQRDRAG